MANEFKIKHGFISTGDGSIEGGLTITGAGYADNNSRIATRPWVSQFLSDNSYATSTDISDAIDALVASAPGTLDTLNELAAALGDDPNFSTTITNSIATKLPLAGGTMSGNIRWTSTGKGLEWVMNTDGAGIKFYNTGDADTNSRLEYYTTDNGNEYHRFMVATNEEMTIKSDGVRVTNNIYMAGDIVATQSWVSTRGYGAASDITALNTRIDEEVMPLFDTKADVDHNHDYLPLAGGTLTGTLTLNATNPRIDFNGTSDGGIDMSIVATPEGLDFLEPEDGNKVHFQILDDAGVNSPFGYKWNGQSLDVRYAAASHTHAYSSLTGIPTSFTPSAHTHAITDVDGLEDELEAKQPAGSYLLTTGKAADSELLDGINSSGFVQTTGDQTITGTKRFSNSSLVIEGSHASISFIDDTSGADDFYIHVNSNNFYVLLDREGGNSVDGDYETPHPLEIQGDTSKVYFFGNQLKTAAYQDSSAFDAAGAAETVNIRIDEEVLSAIPTNVSELTNDAGYITDGNTGWNNSYGFITASDSITGNAATATSATKVVTIQDTAPAGTDGKLWWESDTGKLKVYYGSSSTWVDALPLPDTTNFFTTAGGSISGDVQIGQTLTVEGNVTGNNLNISNWDTAFSWGNHASQGYITDGNTNWNNTYGFITASSTDTLTNKSGNISQWTNDSGYITDGNTNWNNTYGFITGVDWTEIAGDSANINLSQFTNDAGYITDGNTNWNNTYGFITASDNISGNAATATLATKASKLSVTSNDTFSGTYPVMWHDSDFVYSSSWLAVRGSDDTLLVPNVIVSGNISIGSISNPDGMIENTNGGYLHIGGWGVGRTAATAVLVNTAYRADRLDTARNIALAGDVTGSANFDGSANISITATVANDSHTHDGRYYTESESDARFVNVTGDTVTGDLAISGATLSVTSTGEGTEAFFVDGVNGRLFTISDDLSDSLFSANTISGLPVIEAFADNTVKLGPYSNPVIIDPTGSLTIGGATAATQSYVDTSISNLIGGAPGALDTLNELAAAINDDASYASTVTTALGTKAPLASPALTGNPTAPTQATSNNSTRIATTAFVKAQGYVTTDTNYYLNGVTKSGNTLTFAVNGATNQTYTFGSNAFTSYSNHVGLYDSAGSAAAVDTRIDEEVLPSIPTVPSNVSAFTNDAGYITDGNTNWNNSYGFITASGSITGNAATATTATNLGSSYTADTWFRATGDDNTVKFYGNSRMMVFRTDGEGGDTGHTGYAFKWTYGGDGTGATRMLLDNNGNLWTSSYGWLHSAFETAGAADAVQTWVGEQNFATDAAISTAIGTVTLASLGYTGATNANYITNNNELTNGAGYITGSGSITGNAATATRFSTDRTNYKGVTDDSVIGQMMWKNYGNNHTIFDASNSTTPGGTACSNSTPEVPWTNTYPTLMGWNGSSTYGVRVDSAGLSDNSLALGGLSVHSGRNNEANKVVRTDGNGYIQAGWINSTSGNNGTTAISRIYASQDGYIRYYSPENFISVLGLVTTSNSSSQSVVTIQDDAPGGSAGKLWWESDTGKLKVYYGSAWVDASPVPDVSIYYPKSGGHIAGDVLIEQTLTVVGNTLIEGTLTETSDIRLKENIAPLENSLEKVMNLEGVSFNKKDTPEVSEIGFIAQQVEEIIPELITETESGIKTVSYTRVSALLVETVKEQQKEIEDLKAMVADLVNKVNNL